MALFNAEEAKKRSEASVQARALEEITPIADGIQKATDIGSFSIIVNEMSPATKDMLENNGYEVVYNQGDQRDPESSYTVRWD